MSNTRKKNRYTLEASNDRKNWKYITHFEEGERSRFDKPFSPEVAIDEAYGFQHVRSKDYKHVRVIIEL